MWLEIIIFVLLAYIAVVFGCYLLVGLWQSGPALWSATAAPFTLLYDHAVQYSRRVRLEREINARMRHGIKSDEQLLAAAHATTQIQVAHQWLQESTAMCLDTHWGLARALRAEHMSEAASHPKAAEMRLRNVDLAGFLAEVVARYPYATPELIELEVAVPRVAATCVSCPFWFTDRTTAPKVCPSAGALGYGASPQSGRGQRVVDAELVDED